jgi:hypothetical protein
MRATNTRNADVIDKDLSGEWLQSRSGERFSIRIPASATMVLTPPRKSYQAQVIALRFTASSSASVPQKCCGTNTG